jgi:2-polyprenyl-3-methyl-5-hydroxy-6-metoxy-1,4-benzoquinol methylase
MATPVNEAQVWDNWNSTYCLGTLDAASQRRHNEIIATLAELNIPNARILEVGCGTGRLSAEMRQFGKVTAIDLGVKIIEMAQQRYPDIDFRTGNVHTLDLPAASFDVVVTLETLSHVPDQPGFLHRLAELLKPGRFLLITTQNKSVFERRADIGPPNGWIRKWLTMGTLKKYLRDDFDIKRATTLEPEGHMGFLRVVNSRRVNNYLNAALGAPRVKRLKESRGYGQTIFVVGAKR